MNRKLIIFSIIIILILGGVFLLFKLPGHSIEWQNATSFFYDFFKPKPITIVVFGLSNEKLADAILMVYYVPEKSKVFLISIPRDLWIADKKEQFKINEVFSRNKTELVLEKIEDITGLKVNGYLVVNLKTIKEMIDELGGVDITLSEPAIDWVSGYTLGPGTAHLNGEDAVWLIRNRFNPEGDFFREKNQHQIIEKAFEKFKLLNQQQKFAFMKKFFINSETLKTLNLDSKIISELLFKTDVSELKIKSVVLDFSTKLFRTAAIPIATGTINSDASTTKNISVLLPTEGFEKYDQIREYIKAQVNF
jgi:LCP family protein required for cell wall assembly